MKDLQHVSNLLDILKNSISDRVWDLLVLTNRGAATELGKILDCVEFHNVGATYVKSGTHPFAVSGGNGVREFTEMEVINFINELCL